MGSYPHTRTTGSTPRAGRKVLARLFCRSSSWSQSTTRPHGKETCQFERTSGASRRFRWWWTTSLWTGEPECACLRLRDARLLKRIHSSDLRIPTMTQNSIRAICVAICVIHWTTRSLLICNFLMHWAGATPPLSDHLKDNNTTYAPPFAAVIETTVRDRINTLFNMG